MIISPSEHICKGVGIVGMVDVVREEAMEPEYTWSISLVVAKDILVRGRGAGNIILRQWEPAMITL